MAITTFSLAFDVIARYAEQHGWMPIGWRSFVVGPWTITVNGTRESRDHISPYHALIAHRDIVACLLISPLSGSVGGWQGAEDAFIRDMEAEIARPSEPRTLE